MWPNWGKYGTSPSLSSSESDTRGGGELKIKNFDRGGLVVGGERGAGGGGGTRRRGKEEEEKVIQHRKEIAILVIVLPAMVFLGH